MSVEIYSTLPTVFEKIMDEKFKKHYLSVVKAVTDQGEQIKRLNTVVFGLQSDVAKLKHEILTRDMSPDDKAQFERVFVQKDEEANKIDTPAPATEDPKQPAEGVQKTIGV